MRNNTEFAITHSIKEKLVFRNACSAAAPGNLMKEHEALPSPLPRTLGFFLVFYKFLWGKKKPQTCLLAATPWRWEQKWMQEQAGRVPQGSTGPGLRAASQLRPAWWLLHLRDCSRPVAPGLCLGLAAGGLWGCLPYCSCIFFNFFYWKGRRGASFLSGKDRW